MAQAFNNVFGITVYCETRGQGAIVLNIPTLQPSGLPYNDKFHIKGRHELFNCFNGDKICCGGGGSSSSTGEECTWVLHGSASLNENLLEFTCLSDDEYFDYADGWKMEYFKKNIYDQFGNDLSEYGFKIVGSVHDGRFSNTSV